MRIAQRMGVVTSHALPPVAMEANAEVAALYGIRCLHVRPRWSTSERVTIKRAVDICGAATLLILLSPLFVLLAVLVKLTTKGPVIYKAPRVGKGGRHFTFLKFRSMCHDRNGRGRVAHQNELAGHVFKIREDPRVTRLGRFLRRSSLDELPQLINVLRGEMSLVGPRPLPAEDLELDGSSSKFWLWTDRRSHVLPGITGLWQISGRSSLPFEKWIEYDLEYLQNWSLGLDIRILLRTPLAVLTGRGAC